MRLHFFRRRPARNSHLFNAQYIDPKALFAYYFDRLPSVTYITEVDVNAACAFIRQRVAIDQIDCYQHSQYNYDTGRPEFNVTFLVLEGARLIEIGSDYVAILHDSNSADWVIALLREVAVYRTADASRAPIGFATRQELNN